MTPTNVLRRPLAGAALLAAGLFFAAAAPALTVTTDWHEEPHADPDGQLAAPVLAAAVRNDDHIYEMHLICGTDQYDGPNDAARRPGTVVELAVSTFNADESHAAIPAAADDGPVTARLAIGDMTPKPVRFRREGYTNVVSTVFDTDTALGGRPALARLIEAAGNHSTLTVAGLLDHESVSLPISTANETVARFLARCPLTSG